MTPLGMHGVTSSASSHECPGPDPNPFRWRSYRGTTRPSAGARRSGHRRCHPRRQEHGLDCRPRRRRLESKQQRTAEAVMALGRLRRLPWGRGFRCTTTAGLPVPRKVGTTGVARNRHWQIVKCPMSVRATNACRVQKLDAGHIESERPGEHRVEAVRADGGWTSSRVCWLNVDARQSGEAPIVVVSRPGFRSAEAQAAMSYSWMMPPSTSRRLIVLPAGGAGLGIG